MQGTARLSTQRGERAARWGRAALAACAALALLAWLAPPASAGDMIFWNNYEGNVISFANADGSGGGQLNTTGGVVSSPEGTAIDSATGRIFWSSASEESQGIYFANLDNSGGGGKLDTGAAPVEAPLGIAIDPTTRTIYWANGGNSTIGYASLDGGGGGQLNVGVSPIANPGPVAIDLADRRIYWGNYEGTEGISFAKLDGSGGSELVTTGATAPEGPTGLAIDEAARKIYWLSESSVSFASLDGGSGGDLNIGSTPSNGPYGLALDAAGARIYWANYSNGEERQGALAYATLNAPGGAGLNVTTAPVGGPQDPVILRAPGATGAPALGFDRASGGLTCSPGGWAADQAGAFLYQAPRSVGYQWLLNGAPIAGANANAYTAMQPGSYSCTVTASNYAGSTAQSSAAQTVRAAQLKISVKPRKAHAKAGHAATFKVKAKNAGDLASPKARICVKAPKKAKKALKVPKCRRLAPIAPGKAKTVKLKVKAKRAAAGTYKLTILVRGAKASKAKAKLVVKAGR